MKRSLLLLLAAGCHGHAQSPSGGGPPTDGPLPAADGPTMVRAPTPSTAICAVSCPRLVPVGPVIELASPAANATATPRITFAGGHWYVAWEASPRGTTLIQRLTAEGLADGPARRLDGTTPLALVSVPGGQQLILYGWIPEALTPGGTATSLHRLGLDLQVLGAPLLARAPGILDVGHTVEATPAGTLLVTSVLTRPGGLVREVRLDPDQPASGELPHRDWRPGSIDGVDVLDRIGGQRVLVDQAEGSLRFRPLLDDGTIGPATPLVPASARGIRLNTFVKTVGDRVWVGGYAPQLGTTIRMRAVDPATRMPAGDPVVIDWPGDGLFDVLDANGTLVLMGNLLPPAGGMRASLVAVDPAARAACAPNTVSVAGLSDFQQVVTAVHFEGDTAGIAIDTHALDGLRRTFFTRLRCAR